MSWINVGVAAAGVASSLYASNQASKAQQSASNASIAEQQRQYNTSMQMLEPQRMLGYQALADIASLYGYATPGYQPVNNLLGGFGGGGAGGIGMGAPKQDWYEKGVGGVFTGNVVRDYLGFGGRRDPQVSVKNGMIYFDGRRDGGTLYGGHINPVTGEVWVDKPGTTNRDAALSEQATAALRSGKSLEGGAWGRFNLAYNQLAGAGWKYDPSQTPNGLAASGLGPRPAGQPGNMDRFFASPDYNFRRTEGMRGLEQSAAARGGAFSGDALKDLQSFNSGLASGEYGNYMNRLFNMAGMGQTATGQAMNAGQNYANNYSQAQQYQGDARASGIASGITGATNALNQGMYNWNMGRYINGMQSQPYYNPSRGYSGINTSNYPVTGPNLNWNWLGAGP